MQSRPAGTNLQGLGTNAKKPWPACCLAKKWQSKLLLCGPASVAAVQDGMQDAGLASRSAHLGGRQDSSAAAAVHVPEPAKSGDSPGPALHKGTLPGGAIFRRGRHLVRTENKGNSINLTSSRPRRSGSLVKCKPSLINLLFTPTC